MPTALCALELSGPLRSESVYSWTEKNSRQIVYLLHTVSGNLDKRQALKPLYPRARSSCLQLRSSSVTGVQCHIQFMQY